MTRAELEAAVTEAYAMLRETHAAALVALIAEEQARTAWIRAARALASRTRRKIRTMSDGTTVDMGPR